MKAFQRIPLILACVLLLPLAAQSPTPAFSLNITAEPEAVKPGGEVALSITLTNNARQQIFFQTDRYHPERNFTISVMDPAGEGAGKTRAYRDATGDKTGKDAVEPPADPTHAVIIMGSRGISGVLPGRSLLEKVVLNKLFDLNQPGKYTIQVEKVDDLSKTVIKSNIVAVTVAN